MSGGLPDLGESMLEHVPTVEELARRGLAQRINRAGDSKSASGRYRISPEGQEEINGVMARNAAITRAAEAKRQAGR